MPHWSDKHTQGDVCQPLVRKETAVPPGSIRSSKRNTCFEKHAQWKYTWEVHFSVTTFCRGKVRAGTGQQQVALNSRYTFTTLHSVVNVYLLGDSNLHNQRHEGIMPHFLLHFILCVYILFYFTFFYLYPHPHPPVTTHPSPHRIPLLLVFNPYPANVENMVSS